MYMIILIARESTFTKKNTKYVDSRGQAETLKKSSNVTENF